MKKWQLVVLEEILNRVVGRASYTSELLSKASSMSELEVFLNFHVARNVDNLDVGSSKLR